MKTHHNHHKPILLFLATIFSLLMSMTIHAAGLLQPKNTSYDALSIRDHHVSVIIEDGYAITTIEQSFFNPQQQDLEAVYSFSVPEHSSVTEFTMWIDGKAITGEVLENKEARQIYEKEKQAGRDAGLTEKKGYKTFEISVTPVRAQQETRVRLVYIQSAHVDTSIGRYVYPLENGGVDEQQLRFWNEANEVQGSFSFDLTLRSAYPVTAVRLPNQDQTKAVKNTMGDWTVHMGQSQITAMTDEEGKSKQSSTSTNAPAYTLDKDIVVYWRLADNIPGSVDLVAYKPDANGRGTFMMTITPGDDLGKLTQGNDWVFVLDISGSMNGKYATLADGVHQALGRMRPEDRFRIVVFNSYANEVTSGFVNATHENVTHYATEIANIKPGTSTNLFAGLKLGIDTIDADRTTGIVLVTDGVANVGETKQKNFIKLIKKKDIRLFTFIMGNSSNRPMLEAMTKASGGFAMNVSNSDDIVGKILLATSKISHQALHGVEVNINGVKTADRTPDNIGSLYRGQQLIVFGHYWGDGMANVEVKGRISGQPKSYNTRFNFPATVSANPEIERLWAYATIEDLRNEMEDFGENADLKQAVVDIAKQYSLVTDYTSMIVVRDEVFDMHGIDRLNKKRTQVEHVAQAQRAQQPVQTNRVDTSQPMYRSHRPSFGGGAFDLWFVLLLPALLWHRAMV